MQFYSSLRSRVGGFLLVFSSFLNSSCGSSSSAEAIDPSTREAEPRPTAPVGALAEGEPLTLLPIEADDSVFGSQRAAVTLVGFLDFECRFCAQGFSTLLELREKYDPEQLRIVFKHLPLEFHEHAVPAAAVGQVVQLESGPDGFLKFAKEAFANQDQLTLDNLARWAEHAGVDRETYNNKVSDPTLLERIISDVQVAGRLGVEATPTFFVNGRIIGGAQPIEVFQSVITDELSAMQGPDATWAKRYQARIAKNMGQSLVEALLEEDPHDYKVPIEGSPTTGPATAPVTIVEFSDYQCPFCKRAESTVERVEKNYGDRVRLVFKHLPLPFHELARPAALLAAAVQSKKGDAAFFSISRDLFSKSPELGRSTLIELGTKHGLDKDEVIAAIEGEDEQAVKRLQADAQLADDVVARGTPHFFINGKRLSGARPYEHFSALIDYEIKRAQALLGQGVPAQEIYGRLQRDARSPGAPKKLEVEVPIEGRPVRGPSSAKIAVHVFSDFECPYCRLAEQNIAQLEQQFPNQLKIVWHNFPLPFHERALPLARAAQYAFEKKGSSAFWAVHDEIFALDEDQARLSAEDLKDVFFKLGLDARQLSDVMETEQNDDRVLADQALADSVGIRGTPAFIIGGYLVTGAKPTSYLARAVELAIADQKAPTEN